jgi:uncharacterized protein YraI
MKFKFSLLAILLGAIFFAACSASPTATPTRMPPTPTVPPTDTSVPTRTPIPPTPTKELPTATNAPPTATQIPPVATAKIIINVRAGPGAGYPILGKLNKGQKKAIIGKSEDSMWWQIQFDSKGGWIPADFADVQGGTNLVAVVSVEPLPTPTQVPTQLVVGHSSTPTATPTVQVPPPAGRVYFVIQQHAAWLKPDAKNDVYSDVTVGTPADIGNLNISTNASPLDWSEAAGRLAYVFNNGGQDKLQAADQNLDSHGAILTPRWFGDGSQIAFVGYDNGTQSQLVYVVNADGSKPANYRCYAARGSEQLRGLAVNKRTGDIAFVSNYSGTFEIWKMDRFCHGAVQLSKDNADDSAPAFSPDGSKIAYVSNKTAPTDHRIYVMSANGGDGVSLGPGESFAPAFSPDGSWLTFEHNLEVYIMDAYGNSTQPLAPGSRPTWAP